MKIGDDEYCEWMAGAASPERAGSLVSRVRDSLRRFWEKGALGDGSRPRPAAGVGVAKLCLRFRWALPALALFATPVAADDSSFPAFFGPVPSVFSHSGLDLFLGTVTGYTYYYFALEHTDDLNRPFTTLALSLGSPGPTFHYPRSEEETRGFIRIAAIDLFSPRDTDRDCMDDYWELTQGLDPMDPSDAFDLSDLDGSKTNLQYYLFRFGAAKVTTLISPEVSIRTFVSAISPEVSISTAGRLEAISPEVSVLVGPGIEAVSPEVSVLVVPGIEAVSPEVSVRVVPP